MLKKYPVDQLKTGMVIGRTVYAEDMSVLLGEGTVLDEQRIEYLDQRGIVFVRILMPDSDEAIADAEPPQAKKEKAIPNAQEQTAMEVVAAAETAKKEALAKLKARATERAAQTKEEPKEAGVRDDVPLPGAAAEEKPDNRPTSKSGIVLRETSVLEAAYIEQYEACFEELRGFLVRCVQQAASIRRRRRRFHATLRRFPQARKQSRTFTIWKPLASTNCITRCASRFSPDSWRSGSRCRRRKSSD